MARSPARSPSYNLGEVRDENKDDRGEVVSASSDLGYRANVHGSATVVCYKRSIKEYVQVFEIAIKARMISAQMTLP